MSFASFVAPKKIYCTHPQVCNLASSLLPKMGEQPEIVLAYRPKGDIHEATPTAKEMKQLSSSEYLIVGPTELHPWSKKLTSLRSNLLGGTIFLALENEDLKIYPKASRHALAHFWAYPEIALRMQEQLASEFANRFGIQRENEPESHAFFKAMQTELPQTLSHFKSVLVISTHDALVPLFQKSNVEIISLKGHEGKEVSPILIKKIENNIKSNKDKKIIWIFENNISVSPQIKKLVDPKHKQINLSIEGKAGEGIETPIKQLVSELKKLI